MVRRLWNIGCGIGRYWLLATLVLLTVIWALGPLTVDAQVEPTATPDVNTVPPIHLFDTPTPRPPVPVVTATPLPTAPDDSEPNNRGPNGESTPPANNDGAGNNDDSGNSPTGGADADGGAAVPNSQGAANDNTALPAAPLRDQPMVDGPLLTLEMQPNRAFIWQQQQLRLTLIVRNTGKQSATAVQLRSDLPRFFAVAAVHSEPDTIFAANPLATAGTLLAVSWPTLAPGASRTVVLDLMIVPTTPNGSFIDTFAVVTAQHVAEVVAGLSIAMPPAQPPHF